MPKQIEIPASELRVGDKIINYGVVTYVSTPGYDQKLRFIGFGREKENISLRIKSDRLLTIERHELVVVERWLPISPSLGYATLEIARECAEGRPIERLTFHDDVLVSSEVVK